LPHDPAKLRGAFRHASRSYRAGGVLFRDRADLAVCVHWAIRSLFVTHNVAEAAELATAPRFSASLTLAPRNKVTPVGAFSSCFPHYDYHNPKRLAVALNGACTLIYNGKKRLSRQERGDCKKSPLNLRLGFMANARNLIAVN
jgi:hypothetical protein